MTPVVENFHKFFVNHWGIDNKSKRFLGSIIKANNCTMSFSFKIFEISSVFNVHAKEKNEEMMMIVLICFFSGRAIILRMHNIQ
jgi:hypothetical protein